MSSSSVENNHGELWTWALDDVQKTWDQYFANDVLKFRVYVEKGNRRESARRLTRLLYANKHWLNSGRDADLDQLYDEFCAQLLFVGIWLNDNAEDEDAWDVIGGPDKITMGMWPFIGAHLKRDGLQNLSVLYGLATGQGENVAAQLRQKRLDKRDAVKELEACWKEVVRHAVMKLSADQIRMLYPAVSSHCDELQQQVDWISQH